MRNDALRLDDIREAIGQIEKYSVLGQDEFDRNELIRVIWSDAIGFRNVLVHQYFGIDLEAVWQVVVGICRG